MNLPKQTQPVIRQATAAKNIIVSGVQPSGNPIACSLCALLPEPAQSICKALAC